LQEDFCALAEEYGVGFLDGVLIHRVENDLDGVVGLEANESKLIRTIHKYDPIGIVAVDPVRDFSIGDISGDADMLATCLAFGRVARSGNPERGLVLVHHALTGFAGAQKGTGWDRSSYARNSKVIFSWARSQMNIVLGSPELNGPCVITCAKNNNGPPFQDFAVQLNQDTLLFVARPNFDFEEWKTTMAGKRHGGGRKVTTDVEAMLDLLGEEGLTNAEWCRQAKEKLGIPKSTFLEHRDKLKKNGKIVFEHGKWYRIW
jgi:hypothetical protein